MIAAITRFLARAASIFRRAADDDDFTRELESHVEMLTADHIARGMSPAEARRGAPGGAGEDRVGIVAGDAAS
jgi:hypothetical protein